MPEMLSGEGWIKSTTSGRYCGCLGLAITARQRTAVVSGSSPEKNGGKSTGSGPRPTSPKWLRLVTDVRL